MLKQHFLTDPKFQLGFLVFLAFCSFFINNGFIAPSIMEARNFITAREILESKDWLVPTMNGYPRLAKPPLPTWITAIAGMLGGIENEVVLRLPAAIIATLMLFFLYQLAKVLSENDPYIPFLSAAILGTSFAIVFMGRQGTWDIFCHSFMLGAIWLWVKAWKQKQINYNYYLWSGLLLGFAFLSKGPIPFFALLIPFLISYSWGYGWVEMRRQWKGMAVALFLCLIISGAWPLYIHLIEPEALALNVQTETNSWTNRHVRPFWHYWSFPIQTGMWTLFTAAALVVPYAKKRVQTYGNYKFLAGWVIITLILLSIPPEKKERYLLPIMIPIALLCAYHFRYLLEVFKDRAPTLWDNIVVKGNAALFILICLGAPIYFWIKVPGISNPYLILFAAAFWGLGAFMIWSLMKKCLPELLISFFILMCLVSLLFIPLVPKLVYTNPQFKSMKELRKLPEYEELNFYQAEVVRPEEIWEFGKIVDTLTVNKAHLDGLDRNWAFVLFSENAPAEIYSPTEFKIDTLDIIYYHRQKQDRKYFVSKISRRK